MPTFEQLARLPVPAGYQRSDPHHWYRPWVKVGPAAATPLLPGEAGTTDISEDTEPILRMAGTATTDSRGVRGEEQSLLGYFWEPHSDHISTAKGSDLNFHPARRGLRPEWARIKEADDLLRLHQQRPLRHRHALSACHSCFDPLNQAPWLSAMQKYVYRVLVINTEMKLEGKGRDYDDVLEDDYIR